MHANPTGRRVRRSLAVAGTAAALLPLLFGCGSGGGGESNDSVAQRLRPAVLAVPGVTGGTVNVTSASATPMITCRLTGDAQAQDALNSTLDGVLRVITAQTPGLGDGSMIDCTITSGSLKSRPSDLGFTGTVYLTALRANYR